MPETNRTNDLTFEEMQDVINRGGAISYRGQHIMDISQLPSEADLAVSAGTEDATAESLDNRIQALLDQRERLSAAMDSKKKSAAAAKPAPEAPAPEADTGAQGGSPEAKASTTGSAAKGKEK